MRKESESNLVWEWFTGEGKLKRRRFFGPDGKATKDIDYRHPDDGTHKFPHEHKWEWDGEKGKRLE